MRLLQRRQRPRRTPRPREGLEVRALLDFGATGARAALARIMPGGAEILGAAQVTGRGGMARPGQAMQRDRIANLAERALSAAESSTARDGELPLIADDALVGLAGPLLLAHREVRHVRRGTPVAPVYQDELLMALESSQRETLAALEEQLRPSRIRRALVGSELVGVMTIREDVRQAMRLPDVMRGVPGMSGDFLSIVLCNLTWPARGLDVLARVLDDLELNLVEAVPIARAVAAVLPVPNAVLVDIGKEHTEIALAEAGTLSDLVSIPMGGDFFSESLTRNLRLSDKHAELVKQRYAQGRGLSSHSPVVRVLREAAERWHRAVEQALLHLAGEAPLPAQVYLYGGGAQLPELLQQLRAQPWTRRLPFERQPAVERLMPYQLRGVSDPRGVLHSSAQVGIAALSAWAARERPALQKSLDSLTGEMAPGFNLAG
jgi:hypothetical protein